MHLAIYALCAMTSLACAVLLYRGFRQSGARLLLWSSLCFVGFFLNNVMLIVDTRLLVDQDLSIIRTMPSLAGISFLLYGLIADSQS